MDIRIDYNEIVEFFFALTRYTSEDEFKNYGFESQFVLEKDIEDYVQHVKATISPILARDIEYLCKKMARVLYYLMYRAVQEKLEDMPSFLYYYKQMDVSEFLEIIYDSLGIEGIEHMTHHEQHKAIKALFKDEQFHDSGEDDKIFMDYIMYPEDIKERLFKVLDKFYQQFVLPRQDKVRAFIEKKLIKHQKLVEEDPESFIENIIYMFSKEKFEDKSTIMYMSYYGEFACSIRLDENDIVVLYGFAAEQRLDDAKRKKECHELLKTLSDEKRYDIIALLGQRAWYSKELADYLGITTATMSYHINKIMTLGIIMVESGERKRLYYSLNKERFKRLIDNMVEDIVHEKDA